MNVLKMFGCLLSAALFAASPVWAQDAETVDGSAEESQVEDQESSDISVKVDSSDEEQTSDETTEIPQANPSESGVDQGSNAETASPADNETTGPEPLVTQAQGNDENGSIRVVTEPAEARVNIRAANEASGRELGISPLKERLSPGTYWLKIELEGYDEAIAEVYIQAGQSAIIRIRLVPEDPSRELKRTAGHALLWPGIVAAITGIVLIEVDPQGSIGTAGFITSGTGVAMTIAGSILLGLARKKQGVYEQQPQWTASPTIDGQGATMSFSKTF